MNHIPPSDQPAFNEQIAISILQHLQKDELQSLLDDDNKLEQLILDLEVIKLMKHEKETLIVSNKSVAEYNLSQAEKLLQNRNLLAETYGHVESLLQQVKEKRFQLESHGNQTSLDTLLALLETEAAKTEEKSEELSENLLCSKLAVGEFVDDYLATRKLMYEQKVKADKLFEITYSQT